jgi:hypothetical protein
LLSTTIPHPDLHQILLLGTAFQFHNFMMSMPIVHFDRRPLRSNQPVKVNEIAETIPRRADRSLSFAHRTADHASAYATTENEFIQQHINVFESSPYHCNKYTVAEDDGCGFSRTVYARRAVWVLEGLFVFRVEFSSHEYP